MSTVASSTSNDKNNDNDNDNDNKHEHVVPLRHAMKSNKNIHNNKSGFDERYSRQSRQSAFAKEPTQTAARYGPTAHVLQNQRRNNRTGRRTRSNNDIKPPKKALSHSPIHSNMWRLSTSWLRYTLLALLGCYIFGLLLLSILYVSHVSSTLAATTTTIQNGTISSNNNNDNNNNIHNRMTTRLSIFDAFWDTYIGEWVDDARMDSYYYFQYKFRYWFYGKDEGGIYRRQSQQLRRRQRRQRRERNQALGKNVVPRPGGWVKEKPRFTPPLSLKLSKPIINVGFPKAGTSSIFSFFHCNGLKGQHWYCCEEQSHPAGTSSFKLMSRCVLNNLKERHLEQQRQNQEISNNNDNNNNNNNDNNITQSHRRRQILEGCGDYDFYSELNGPRIFKDSQFRMIQDDGRFANRHISQQAPRMIIPQHHYLQEIHEQFPNATFLLNIRPTQAWVESVIRWDVTLYQELLNEFWYQDQWNQPQDWNDLAFPISVLQTLNISGFPISLGTNATTNITTEEQKQHIISASLAYIMEYHSNFIRRFVKNHPTHALVEIDITDPNAGQYLADTFGLNETCWEHRNKNTNSAGASKNKDNNETLSHQNTKRVRPHHRIGKRRKRMMDSKLHPQPQLDEFKGNVISNNSTNTTEATAATNTSAVSNHYKDENVIKADDSSKEIAPVKHHRQHQNSNHPTIQQKMKAMSGKP